MDKIVKSMIAMALVIFALPLSAQLSQHGLVLNGGTGRVDAKIDRSAAEWTEIDTKTALSVGYRLRFKEPLPKSIHFDLDVNAGANFLKTIPVGYYGSSSTQYYYASIAGMTNYSIIKNLSAGLGLEPMYFFRQSGEKSQNKFDIPVVAKIAYNLKFVEIGIYGKYGLTNIMETRYLKSGKFRDIQLSLFIPF